MLAKNDDESVFLTLLYKTYFHKLWGYAYSLTEDKDNADDTVQMVFTNIIKHVGTLKSLKDIQIKAYLNAAVRNTVYNHRKKRENTAVVLELHQADGYADNTSLEDTIHRRLDFEEITAAMRHLDEREKDMLTLYYFVDLSYSQIAGLMGLTENHVGVILHRAVQKLKMALTGGEING